MKVVCCHVSYCEMIDFEEVLLVKSRLKISFEKKYLARRASGGFEWESNHSGYELKYEL